MSFRRSTASPDNTGIENWTVRDLGDARTFTFDNLTLEARVTPESTFDDVGLRFEVPQSGAVHEFHLPSQPSVRAPQTGLIYARHPTEESEIQFACTRFNAQASDAPLPSTTGAVCTVTEMQDGIVERTERIPLTVDAPVSVDFRGGKFEATLMSWDEEGLIVSVGWPAPPTRQVGISQLLRNNPAAKPFTFNQLARSMTGLASVRTPSGSHLSYVCEAQ